MKKWSSILLCALVFSILAWRGAAADFFTHDEGPFLHYGYQHLQREVPRNQRFNSKLPVNALHALPVLVGERVYGGPAFGVVNEQPMVAAWPIPWGRAAGVALGALLVVAVGATARSLAGPRAGFAAALLAALEPNLLAHFHLVTADGGATLATFLVTAASLRFARSRSLLDAALTGGALGLVFLSKFMLVIWVFSLVAALLAVKAWSFRGAAVALLALLVVLNAGFFFRGFPGHLPEAPRSKKVSLAKTVIGRAPLPVPEAWIDGLDWTAGDEEKGVSFGNLYLLGEVQTDRRGWPWYYLVVFALKLPLPLMVLAALGFAWNRERAWWLPRILALSWLAFLSLANHAQIGIRHALPVLPLIILEASAAYVRLEVRRPWLARMLILWLGASVISFAPDYIPYTNELIPDRKQTYRFLADSNVDWGQAKLAALEFLQSNPDVAFQPDAPVHGRVLVSVNHLVGVLDAPEKYAWLRQHRPVGHIRHAYLLFRVP